MVARYVGRRRLANSACSSRPKARSRFTRAPTRPAQPHSPRSASIASASRAARRLSSGRRRSGHCDRHRLRSALAGDPARLAALSPGAVSYPIETAWNEAVDQRLAITGTAKVWPTKQMVLMTLPTDTGQTPQMVRCQRAHRGVGALYGLGATCILQFEDRLFFGSVDGLIVEAEVTGADRTSPMSASASRCSIRSRTPASLKTALAGARHDPLNAAHEVKLSLQHDFVVRLPSPPDDTSIATGSLWGTALWGTSTWGAPLEKQHLSGMAIDAGRGLRALDRRADHQRQHGAARCRTGLRSM
jgi:hypothetical protein